MKVRISLVLAAMAIAVAGCATKPQQPVSLAQDAIGVHSGRIGVAMTAMPKLDTQVPGAGCLLCLGAAMIANSSLTTHAQTLPYEDLPDLKAKVASLLRKKGATVTVIDEALDLTALPNSSGNGDNLAKKDFSSLHSKYNIDRVLVIDLEALGFIRTYSAYIPTSDPKALFRGSGYMVNLATNAYEWYLPVFVTKSADGKWDEPPTFPGLTNAYFQALELGKDALLKPISVDVTPIANAERTLAKETVQ